MALELPVSETTALLDRNLVLGASSFKNSDSKLHNPGKWSRIIRNKLFIYAIVSLLFCGAFRLVFLPRTLLSRDLKRWHYDHIVKADLKRMYLALFGDELVDNLRLRYTNFGQSDLGIPGDNSALVETLSSILQEGGFKKAQIKKNIYTVPIRNPIKTEIHLVSEGKVVYSPALAENGKTAYLPFAANGSVTAPYCYAHYGRTEDFEAISSAGADINGTITIMRAGLLPASVKIANAARYGAVGAVLYSDTDLDGQFTADKGYDVFPNGPARNPEAISLTSVKGGDMIPSVPVSFRDIQPILAHLNGKGANLNWTGGLHGVNYSAGPSDPDLKLKVLNLQEERKRKISNLILRIPGIYSSEKIFVGANIDAMGPKSPRSNANILTEVALRFGGLLKLGWKPFRDIEFAFWDGGEAEYGSVGVEHYLSQKKQEVLKNCLLYINLESIKGSTFGIQSNLLSERMAAKAANQVSYNNGPFFDSWSRNISVIGSTLDAYHFEQVGVPSVNMGFYNDHGLNDLVHHEHSVYDDAVFLERLDPQFDIHRVLCKYLGLFVLNFDEKEIVGFEYGRLSEGLVQGLSEIDFEGIKGTIDEELIEEIFGKAEYLKYVGHEVGFKQFVEILRSRILDFKSFAQDTDLFLQELQNNIIEDYPWFLLYKKISLFFRIKHNNNKLKKIAQKFVFEGQYFLTGGTGNFTEVELNDGGILPQLKVAANDGNFKDCVKWGVLLLRALDNIKTQY